MTVQLRFLLACKQPLARSSSDKRGAALTAERRQSPAASEPWRGFYRPSGAANEEPAQPAAARLFLPQQNTATDAPGPSSPAGGLGKAAPALSSPPWDAAAAPGKSAAGRGTRAGGTARHRRLLLRQPGRSRTTPPASRRLRRPGAPRRWGRAGR